jgi:tetratricopeptide (TPR) repeat protein
MPSQPRQQEQSNDLSNDDGWDDDVDQWSTDAIFRRLRAIGVDTDADRFRGQAIAAGDIRPLQDAWFDQLSASSNGCVWDDLPYYAVPELWRRLAPDVNCPGRVEEELYEAISAEEGGKPLPDIDGLPAGLGASMRMVRFLQLFSPAERSAKFAAINFEGGYYDYLPWLSDLVEIHAAKHPNEATQLADVLSECAEGYRYQIDLALGLIDAGRPREAVARVQATLEKFPQSPWALINGGDVHEKLGDIETAIRRWTEALALREDWDAWESAAERLEAVLTEAGRRAEYDAIIEAHPAPPQPPPPEVEEDSDDGRVEDDQGLAPLAPILPDWQTTRIEPLKAPPKVGRNDPCPCGSGKKYKKCCMK